MFVIVAALPLTGCFRAPPLASCIAFIHGHMVFVTLRYDFDVLHTNLVACMVIIVNTIGGDLRSHRQTWTVIGPIHS